MDTRNRTRKGRKLEMNEEHKPEAILVFGGIVAVARLPELTASCELRDLSILALDEPSPMANAVADRIVTEPDWRPAVAEFHLEDGDDLASFVDRIDRWRDDYRIVGAVCTVDSLVPMYGLVCDWLGLPNPGYRATTVCRSKFMQRRYLAALSPKSRYLGDPANALKAAQGWDHFPAVLKPSGRSSSSGVVAVKDLDSLALLLDGDRYKPDEVLLLEEAISGPEFSVEALSHDGEVEFVNVTHKRTNAQDSDYFVEMGHTLPAQIDDATRKTLVATHDAVLDRLGFRSGISHGEYRRSPDGRVWLMEVAARTPGDGFVAAYHLATGSPLEAAQVDIARGLPAHYGPLRRIVRQVYFDHEPGVLDEIQYTPASPEWPQRIWWMPEQTAYPRVDPSKPEDPGHVHMVLGLNRIGDTLRPIRESHHRAATAIIDARSEEELDAVEAELRARLRIVTR